MLGIMISSLNSEEIAVVDNDNTCPCVLQDAQLIDGEWYLFGSPVVFDEECCGIMAQIFNNELPVYPIAAYAEYTEFGCYLMHLD